MQKTVTKSSSKHPQASWLLDIIFPHENQDAVLFIHVNSEYEIFIQVAKGYKVIGPMRA
jgi:hypothetical protein